MWTTRVFTLYPELFPGPLGSGLHKKALEKKLWSLEVVNIRDYALDKHKTVDEPPFGGGSGMIMRADIIDQLVHGADEGDLIESGLEDTMRVAFQEILENKLSLNLPNFRTAAYIIALKKIEKSFLELGL